MKLPTGWAKARIADAFTINPKHPADADRTQPVSFVPMPAVDEDLGAITSAVDRALSEIWSGYTHFSDGDVIFAKITPCMENGKAAVAQGLTNGMACGSTEFYVFRPEEGISPHYLWRFLRQHSFRAEAEPHMTGAVGQRRVPRDFLAEYALPLPPRAEQRRIVAKMDALTARLSRARAELDRISSLVDRMVKSAYQRAFNNGSPMERLDDVVPSNAPIIYGILQPGPHVANGIPYVRPTEIDNGKVKLAELRRTTAAIAERYKRATIKTGDIILTIVGTIGKVAVVPSEIDGGNITQSSCRIRPDNTKIRPDYLRHWLLSPFAWAQYNSGRLGTAVPRLNLRDVRAFKIGVPSMKEQDSIAKQLDIVTAKAARLEAEIARAGALFDRLEAAIMAKAFRGELVPQDPTDEPASSLLARIRQSREATPKLKRGRRAQE